MISTEITNNFRLSGATKRVYETLSFFRNQDTGECWTSQTKLARDLGYARQTIGRAIKKLTKLKIIAFANKWKHGRYKFYEIFRSTVSKAKSVVRRLAPRGTFLRRHMEQKSSNLLDYDHSNKKKKIFKQQKPKKLLSVDQLNAITVKTTEIVKKQMRIYGKFEKISHTNLVKNLIANMIEKLALEI